MRQMPVCLRGVTRTYSSGPELTGFHVRASWRTRDGSSLLRPSSLSPFARAHTRLGGARPTLVRIRGSTSDVYWPKHAPIK